MTKKEEMAQFDPALFEHIQPLIRIFDEDVPQVGCLLDVKTDGAADAAVGEKIHLPAEGRDVQVLAAVAADGHHVFLAQMEGAGQVYRKGGVAAAVVEHPPPVAEHRGVVGHRCV